nr:S-(hydroxymethyl)mycothiol dehydrogenase [Mycolicibacterium sp.]
MCHTDLTYRDGGINDDYPFLLGHEASGTVETIGDSVVNVAPGDFVILNGHAVCGQCRACQRGRPQLCFNSHSATQKMTLTDGTELSPALAIGDFVEKALVHEGQCSTVDPEADPAAATLLGRGVMAGVGAAINTGAITRGHNDHVTVALELGAALDAPVLLHPADDVLWQIRHPATTFDSSLMK